MSYYDYNQSAPHRMQQPPGSYSYFTQAGSQDARSHSQMNQLPTAFGHQHQPRHQQYDHQQHQGNFRGGRGGGGFQSRGGARGGGGGGRGGGHNQFDRSNGRGRGGFGGGHDGNRGRGNRGGHRGGGRGGNSGGGGSGDSWISQGVFDDPWKSLLTPDELQRAQAKPVPRPEGTQYQPFQPQRSTPPSNAFAPTSSNVSTTTLDSFPPSGVSAPSSSPNSNKRTRRRSSDDDDDGHDPDAPPESGDEEDQPDVEGVDQQFEQFKNEFGSNTSSNDTSSNYAASTTTNTDASIGRSFALPAPKADASTSKSAGDPSTGTTSAPAVPVSTVRKSFMNLPPPKNS